MYNGHGDVVALLDAETKSVAGTYYYDAFGVLLEKTGNVNNNITYAGYQYDEETETYYLNARMYDPKIARFLQEDTYRGSINDPLSLNLYAYTNNNPIKYYDPTGHSPEEWFKNAYNAFVRFDKGRTAGRMNAVNSTVEFAKTSFESFNPLTGFSEQAINFGAVAYTVHNSVSTLDGLSNTVKQGFSEGIELYHTKRIEYQRDGYQFYEDLGYGYGNLEGEVAIDVVTGGLLTIDNAKFIKKFDDLVDRIKIGKETFGSSRTSLAGRKYSNAFDMFSSDFEWIENLFKSKGKTVKVSEVVAENYDNVFDVWNKSSDVFDFHRKTDIVPNNSLKNFDASLNNNVKTLNYWLVDSPDLLEDTRKWYNESPEWWGINPDETPVFYRTKAEVDEIRKLPGESGGHHPHGLALGGPKGQKLTITNETRKIKNPIHSKVTGLQRKVINKIKKQLK